MTNTIVYVLATILCFSGCSSTNVTPVSTPKLPETLPTHTYMDEFIIDPYRSVGSVNFADGVLIGSGVLIAPNLVLTAAHVAERSEDLMFVEYDGDTHYVSQIIYYPGYIRNTINHDIAILVLETKSDEDPVELAEFTYKKMSLTTVGYGTGRKRFSNYGMFWYYGRLITNPQVMIMLPLKATLWFGDSGGAVFSIDNKLVGIMSYFQVDDDGTIYENGCASIEYYRDWIVLIKTIKEG